MKIKIDRKYTYALGVFDEYYLELCKQEKKEGIRYAVHVLGKNNSNLDYIKLDSIYYNAKNDAVNSIRKELKEVEDQKILSETPEDFEL